LGEVVTLYPGFYCFLNITVLVVDLPNSKKAIRIESFKSERCKFEISISFFLTSFLYSTLSVFSSLMDEHKIEMEFTCVLAKLREGALVFLV